MHPIGVMGSNGAPNGSSEVTVGPFEAVTGSEATTDGPIPGPLLNGSAQATHRSHEASMGAWKQAHDTSNGSNPREA